VGIGSTGMRGGAARIGLPPRLTRTYKACCPTPYSPPRAVLVSGTGIDCSRRLPGNTAARRFVIPAQPEPACETPQSGRNMAGGRGAGLGRDEARDSIWTATEPGAEIAAVGLRAKGALDPTLAINSVRARVIGAPDGKRSRYMSNSRYAEVAISRPWPTGASNASRSGG